MRRSTDFFLRTALAWIFASVWRGDWANVAIEQIPKIDLYMIIAVNVVGYYYLFRGIVAWAKGE